MAVEQTERCAKAGRRRRRAREGQTRSWLASLVVHGVILVVMGLVVLPREVLRARSEISTRILDEQPAEFSAVDTVVEVLGVEQRQAEVPAALADRSAAALVEASPARLTGTATAPGAANFAVPEEALTLAFPLKPTKTTGAGADRQPDVGFGNRVSGLLSGRGGDMRGALLKAYGGTEASERAVALGLDWLARHQNRDGSWSLNLFPRLCRGQCSGAGIPSETGGTALGVLPFLGAGHTHRAGAYRGVVERAMNWLLGQQAADGGLISGQGHMYSHGLAAIALCEAYAMSQDSRLRPAAQRALQFIVAAQDPRGGGWRYVPGQPGDTSVMGWQLMALFSGRMGELEVASLVGRKATLFLDRVAADALGARYTYLPGGMVRGVTPAMTAEGLLCRMYLGWPREQPGMTAGVQWLLQNHRPTMRERNIYYWYYATQVMHHMEGEAWARWNPPMRELLVQTQVKRGHSSGSWDPLRPTPDPYGVPGGRLFVTSLSLLTLEVYYRHLPLYDRQRVRQWARRQAAEQQRTAAVGDGVGGETSDSGR